MNCATRMRAMFWVAMILLAAAWIRGGGVFPRPVVRSPPLRYTITGLGDKGGQFVRIHAHSINERDQVVGFAVNTKGRYVAFLWENGRFKDIGSPEDKDALAWCINERSEAVGELYERTGLNDPHAVFFRGGKMVDIGLRGRGFGIDNRSRIVGETDPSHHAFLYDGHRTTDLGTLGGPHSRARKINDRGQIVGEADLAPELSHAFLYSDGKMRDLGTLDGGISSGRAINDKGWVVGISYLRGRDETHPFLYRNGRMEALECHNLWCIPTAINSTGAVVGYSYEEKLKFCALVWIGGRVHNLEDLIPRDSGWQLEQAFDINDRGQILAEGRRAGEWGVRSCILTPVNNSRSIPAPPLWRRLL